MEKNFIMLIGGLFVIIISLTITVAIASKDYEPIHNEISSATQESYNINDNICTTQACYEAGKTIQKSINKSINPCDDFYQFACGQWMTTHTIPPDRARFGNFDDLDEKLQQNIRKELLEPSTDSDAASVQYAADFFKSCIDNATLESRGVEPLLDALNLIGGWPLVDKQFDENAYSWEDSLTKVTGKLGLSTIFAISVQPDANDTLVNRVNLDAAAFGLGRNQLVNRSAFPDIINAYRTYILQTAILLGAKDINKTVNEIEEMINFESQLAKLSTPQEDRRDAKVWYNKMTLAQLNQLTADHVDWHGLINKIYAVITSPIRLNLDEQIIVQDIPYYKGVSQLLDQTPKKIVANYLGWMTASSFGYLTTKRFRLNEFNFNKVTEGVAEETDLWRRCSAYLEGAFEYAVSRKYVDENFSVKDKDEASAMVKDIKESFRTLIKISDWLDPQTQQKSLEKLDAIIENVGYPDWILDNNELDKYYNLTQKVDRQKAFEAMLYIQFNGAFREFEDIRKPVNRTLSWPMPPAIVNAAYEPTQNSITIPAAILKPPFFDSKRPVYMNYGAIGLVIGHELTHGFDDEGSQFDKNGNLVNWWTDQVKKRFQERAKCFVDEYSSYYDPEAKMHLNGNNTVGENIADNGGLREAFNAYRIYVKRHGEAQRLPVVSEYTQEQVFFLSYANVWCSLIRPEALKEMIQYNPHSPASYRVDVPNTNFASFSDTFNCKKGSKMNPTSKCVLW